MGVPSITGLVASCTSLYKHAMIFIISPCNLVVIWMPQQSLNSCPQTLHVISDATPSLTYHVFKKENFKPNESPHQCFFEAGSAEINKNQEYSNFLHTYCDTYHARNISDRHFVTSIAHFFNSTIVECWSKKNWYI